jgi:hypothetical protein
MKYAGVNISLTERHQFVCDEIRREGLIPLGPGGRSPTVGAAEFEIVAYYGGRSMQGTQLRTADRMASA